MNEQENARLQINELVTKHGIKLRVLARAANMDIPYSQLGRFMKGQKSALDPQQLKRVEKFYKRVVG